VSERALSDEERDLVAVVGRGPDGRSTDIESGRGVPRWLQGFVRYCGRCGAALAASVPPGENRERMTCTACGFIAYVNPRLVVTTLPVTEHGELVLIRRGIEPAIGTWAQPGGFLEVDETVGEAAVRETLEETGLVVEPGVLVGLYSRLEAAVVTLVYEARIVGGEARPCAESLEVVTFAPSAVPWAELGFKTSWWALRDWMRLRHPELPVPDAFAGREGF
jgi:ADP-ribose pyrophosphatase YjhB (NUDIX family)